MSRLTNDHTNFNIHWDDLLEMELTNSVEIDAAEFCAKFSINPEDFDSDFVDETANINFPREVCIMSDSQLSEEARHLVNTAKCPVLPVVAPPIQASSVNPVNETETINNTIPNQHEIDDSKLIPNGFINVTEEDVKSFNEKNKNTARKKEGNMRKLSRFLSMKNESRKMYDIPMCELDEILAMFILSIRKEDGGEYETTSIRSFSSTIEKVLQENNYPYTLAKGERQGFPKFRETIASKFKKLKKEGKGNRENAAQPIRDEEIDRLYDQGLLGLNTPQGVLNNLWLKFTINFGMRGVQEHYDLCWGDITLCREVDGTEYLELTERQTKTRTGQTSDIRQAS